MTRGKPYTDQSHTEWDHHAERAWDAASAAFQARRYGDPAELPATVEYGPFAPTEAVLNLLGSVAGTSILEIGCGGGQNAVALATQGARVIAVDLSKRQLAHAQRLAAQHTVDIHFIHSPAHQLDAIPPATIDRALAVYSFQYLNDLPACLAECHRVLRPQGQLLFSVDHPILACFYDQDEQEQTIYPTRSYFANLPIHWRFPESNTLMHTHHHTIAQWIQHTTQAGFQLRRILEPPVPPEILNHHFPEDGALAPLRHLPHTLIILATKTTATP